MAELLETVMTAVFDIAAFPGYLLGKGQGGKQRHAACGAYLQCGLPARYFIKVCCGRRLCRNDPFGARVYAFLYAFCFQYSRKEEAQ